MTARRRLRQIEEHLSPTQAVLKWLGPALEAQTDEEYVRCRSRQALVGDGALIDQVMDATRCSMKGKPRDVVEAAARKAGRDVVFLLALIDRINDSAVEQWAERIQRMILLATQCETLTSAALGDREHGEEMGPQPHSHELPLTAWLIQRATHDILWGLGAGDVISRTYFGGHPVLFAGARQQLQMIEEFLPLVVEAYDDVSDEPLDMEFDRDQIVSRAVRVTVDLARAQTLLAIGNKPAARQVLKPYVEARVG